MPYTAGRKNRGDIEVTFEPQKKGSGLEINIETSIGQLYGEHIKNEISEALSSLNVVDGKVNVVDDGALPYVLQARVEAAVRMAKEEQNEE